MGWPQWVFAVLLALEVLGGFLFHGHARPPLNAANKTLEVALIALLLHAGGFWR